MDTLSYSAILGRILMQFWPVWLALPIGFTLLMLQGWSELIKRFAFLQGLIEDPAIKRDEKSAEEELAESILRLAEAKAKAQQAG